MCVRTHACIIGTWARAAPGEKVLGVDIETGIQSVLVEGLVTPKPFN